MTASIRTAMGLAAVLGLAVLLSACHVHGPGYGYGPGYYKPYAYSGHAFGPPKFFHRHGHKRRFKRHHW